MQLKIKGMMKNDVNYALSVKEHVGRYPFICLKPE